MIAIEERGAGEGHLDRRVQVAVGAEVGGIDEGGELVARLAVETAVRLRRDLDDDAGRRSGCYGKQRRRTVRDAQSRGGQAGSMSRLRTEPHEPGVGLINVRAKFRIGGTPHRHDELVVLRGSRAITQAFSDAASFERS